MGNLANIIFISDLHVGMKNEDTRGIDVRNNIKRIIKTLKSLKYDLLVIGGDLCYKSPEIEIYKWLKKQLDKLGKPYKIIPGNHDDSEMIASVFSETLSGDKLYALQVLRSIPMLFLDSGTGELGEKQWNWLNGILNSISQDRIIIFIHHPPIESGVPYMDNKHSFKEQDQFEELLSTFPDKNFHVFCGHYHVEKRIAYKNLDLQICPSLFFQIDASTEMFNIDHKNIGYIKIGLGHDKLMTSVHYLD